MAKGTSILVIGAGVAGAFAALNAVRRGARTTLLEAFDPGHDRGSSHGGSRIFRHAYEATEYVELASHADVGWEALQRDAEERILFRSGGLDLEREDGPALPRIEAALRAAGRPVHVLDGAEVRRRFPAFAPREGVRALLQPDAGVLAADRAIAAALRIAARSGAELRFRSPVAGLAADGDGVAATTEDGGVLRADRAIVCAGPWWAEGPLALPLPLQVEQQQVLYLEAPPGPDHDARGMPVFIDRDTDTYGMGRLEHPAAVKVSDHSGAPTIRLAERRETHDEERARVTRERVAQLLSRVGRQLAAVLCLYTKTPDEDFLIGPHPALPGVVVAGGFSGHGFKFGPALGEMLVDLALEGKSALWRHRFRLDRFAS